MNPAGLLALDADVPRRLPRPEIDDPRLRPTSRNGHPQAGKHRDDENDSVHGRGLLGMLSLVLRFSQADAVSSTAPTGAPPRTEPRPSGSGHPLVRGTPAP